MVLHMEQMSIQNTMLLNLTVLIRIYTVSVEKRYILPDIARWRGHETVVRLLEDSQISW